MIMSVPVVVGLMLAAYVLVMAYLAVGLRILRRQPVHVGRTRRGRPRWGWPGLIGRVLGTAVGGYLVLMAVVVAYDRGVGRPGADCRRARRPVAHCCSESPYPYS